jgi:hypothetical protein
VSTALGISAVSAVLKSLLNQVYSSANLGTVTVSALAPDIVQANLGAGTVAQVNLFLHQVTPNAAWRNVALPSVASNGSTRLTNPPLALDLHYLLTAYASKDCMAEALLGFGVQLLHENPVLARNQIDLILNPPPKLPGDISIPPEPSPLNVLISAGLDGQIEMIKITPATLGREEMAWLWTALKADYRPTFPFQVSVVLIKKENPVQSPLPVLQRKVAVQPNLGPSWSSVTAVTPPNGQPAASLGDTVTVLGTNLNSVLNVVLTNSRVNLKVPPAVLTPTVTSASSLQFTVPDPDVAISPAVVVTSPSNPVDLPAGMYLLSAQASNGTDVITTNSLPLAIAPRIIAPPSTPVVPDAQGNATVSISCLPLLRAGQQVSLLIGNQEAPANAFFNGTDRPSFTFSSLQATNRPVPVRLRVDGVDSPIIDMTQKPPVFSGPLVLVT